MAAPANEASPELLQRRASIKRMGDPKYIRYENYQKSTAYDVLAATALKGCGPAEWAEYMSRLPLLPPGYTPDGPIEMFTLPPLARYLHQFGDCLSNEQKQRVLAGLTEGGKKQYLTGHGTINHAVMRASSWYLLAQYFPGAMWTDMDGRVYRSDALQALLKDLLKRRSRQILQFGHTELLSPTYSVINLFPLLGLIDFAQDPEVRQMAEAEATLELATLRAHSFHGVIVPPLTRKNFDQVNAQDSPTDYVPAVSQHALWYYFGEPGGLGLYDFRAPQREPFFVSMLALSDWVPPPALMAMAPGQGYAIRMNTPRFGHWDEATPVELAGSSLIKEDFAIGSGNVVFQPGGYSGHIQTFSILLKSDKPQNQIECYHPFWRSNQGEDAWSTDRSSPFQQMFRYDESSVVMIFDIPQRDPWIYTDGNRFFADRSKHADNLLKMVSCRIPRDFEQVVTQPGWVFLRHGKVFVAIATLHGQNEFDRGPERLLKKFVTLKVREPRTALFFRVDREREGLNFAQFQQKMWAAKLPVFDVASASISFEESDGTRTAVRPSVRKLPGSGDWWSAMPEVVRNGKAMLPDESFVVDSPVLTVKDGKVRVRSAAGEYVTKP